MNICVGVIVIATSLITNYCFKLAAKNIAAHLRSRFIKSILRQDAQWFDQQKFGALNTQLNDNISRIHDGIGDKVGLLIRCMCQLIVTLIVCFVIDWRITASMIVSAPLSCLIMSSMARMISSSTAKQLPLLDKSGAILQETIMNVKTVQSCNGQQEMIKKYHDSLLAARIHGILIGVWQGLFDGMFFVVIYVFFAIGLVYGGYLYYMDEIASGDVFIITTMLTMSVYFVGFISPHIMSVFKARVSAAIIYQQIERIPDIDCYNDYGEELPNCKGHIKFEDVKFAYPNRKDRQVLKGVTWEARPSETVALVGHSGCGKSTSISLLTRLYDVTAGKITIDGVDIRNLKITTLRQIIGIVQQEPVLFNGSIFENIKLGDDSITMDKAERACRMANAHDFIQKLEHGYNTNIGSGEIQLSGGQKQRIAIARAIVNNPPILLLDEATSALDAESEIHVQQALKHATQGRTTIVIAHRLSTLRDVQKIIVYDSGAVVEIGSHVELSEKEGGLYSSLVKHQQFKSVDKEQTNEEPMVMKRKETLRGSSLMSRDSVSVPDLGAEIAAEEPEYTDRKPRYGLLTLYKNCQGEYVKFITGAIFCCVRGMELVFYVVGLTLLFDAFRNKEVPWEQFAVGLELVGWFNVALGFYALIAILGSLAFLNWAGENVLIKLKVRALSTILSQGAAYFDRPQTSPPKLVQRITNDSLNCKAAMDIRLYHVLNNAFCTFMQFIVTFAMSWHIGVVGTILYIAILAVLGCMARMMQDGIRAVQKRDDSPKLAVEIIENTKTIQLLTREKYFAEKYDQSLEAPESEEKKVIWADSVTFSITQSAMYLSDVICYSCALWMIYYWDADVTRMFMACNTMSTMSWSILFISISLVEMMHAAPATNSLFSIFGEDLCVDANEEYGETPKVMGNVVAEKVFFSYPTRPDITVTNGLNVKALAGETIALVGPSGGGKSTIINLLQRFYEPKSGNVSVDGNAINSFKLSYLRSEMALVGQEPVLFSGTIYENATLGMEDVDPHWVMEAFELANAKKFIENLPEGYDTEVGEKGAQLSGGQKQRVAIARALVRRPKILLLDEATSALDAESERAVQQALDTAASGRTCITIAHRLSSIQHADKIYFISNGRVTEVGTHAELMNADGAYADMIRKQDLQSTAEN
uniref:ABC transporter ATP-binding protein n=2 Tax=Bursaphelenchus xylophilus TaxID=6326 RepID=A0A1I7RJB3_BURXY